MSKKAKSSLNIANSVGTKISFIDFSKRTKQANPLAAKKHLATKTHLAEAENLSKKRKASNTELEYTLMLSDSDPDNDLLNFETRKWSLSEKINSSQLYSADLVKFVDSKEFSYKYIQKNGFEAPILFTDKSGLGLRVPSKNFTVADVKSCVGSKRVIDVIDVNTQQALTMSMKDWCEYYDNPERARLLNVISLEFSHTKLENYVEAPLVVRQLDWIESAWPQHLRKEHTESTNLIEKMKYPKVQKYVLMSVAECYTDFHIDMGGSSVWYHILTGEKIFWLVPPTENNLKAYERWVLSGEQTRHFLPDLMDECQQITLRPGYTLLIPSGYIHGVYTSEDSLVFGGNFLHSFNIPMQLRINSLESKIKVPAKYRYPFYTEMLWFLMERYVHCYTGVTHLAAESASGCQTAQMTFDPVDINLSECEIAGLASIVAFISSLAENKRAVPQQILQPDVLFESFKSMQLAVCEESHGSLKSLGDDEPFLHWPKTDKKYFKKTLSKIKKEHVIEESSEPNAHECRKHVMRNLPRTKGSIKKRLRPQNVPRSNVERRRRVRCHMCEPCTRDDCGECKYCKDMKKFGGTGISKQCCLSKQCFQPLLPTTTTCMLCDKLISRKKDTQSNLMYECEICFEIYHVDCFTRQYGHLDHIEAVVNEDLSNCWQCANCVNKGYIFKADSDAKSSLSGSFSLNTSFSSFRNEDSPPNLEIIGPAPKIQAKKRHRRTKLEILNSKKLEQERLARGAHKALKDSIISVSSLSSHEKEIILSEFCENIYREQDDYAHFSEIDFAYAATNSSSCYSNYFEDEQEKTPSHTMDFLGLSSETEMGLENYLDEALYHSDYNCGRMVKVNEEEDSNFSESADVNESLKNNYSTSTQTSLELSEYEEYQTEDFCYAEDTDENEIDHIKYKFN